MTGGGVPTSRAGTSWVAGADGSLLPVQNLPYGVFSVAGARPRVGVAIGDRVLDLASLAAVVPPPAPGAAPAFAAEALNDFLALGRSAWTAVRAWLTQLLTDPSAAAVVMPHLRPRDGATMHLPFHVGDYVDFYSSEHHAANVGRIFRPDSAPLTPNWKHLPIGYHGRAGTVVVSGTDVVRPCGQRKEADSDTPSYGPSRRLDIEAEVGFVVGTPSTLGTPVRAGDFRDHVFGVVLVNDWSARDVQAWEYVPLGPFLGKSFATSVSAWVVPLDALEPARLAPPVQDPPPLDYLRDDAGWGLALDLEVRWNGTVVSRPPFATTYWTPAQQLAHLTANGASVRTGDLYASGTVSGPEPGQRGSFLELSWGGRDRIALDDGTSRTFLEDGDTVTIAATAPGADGVRIGLGDVTGTVRPAHLPGPAPRL